MPDTHTARAVLLRRCDSARRAEEGVPSVFRQWLATKRRRLTQGWTEGRDGCHGQRARGENPGRGYRPEGLKEEAAYERPERRRARGDEQARAVDPAAEMIRGQGELVRRDHHVPTGRRELRNPTRGPGARTKGLAPISASSTPPSQIVPTTTVLALTRRWTHGATSEPSRPPTPKKPSSRPISPGDAPRSFDRTMTVDVSAWLSRFPPAGIRAVHRRNGCRHSQASPSRTSSRSVLIDRVRSSWNSERMKDRVSTDSPEETASARNGRPRAIPNRAPPMGRPSIDAPRTRASFCPSAAVSCSQGTTFGIAEDSARANSTYSVPSAKATARTWAKDRPPTQRTRGMLRTARALPTSQMIMVRQDRGSRGRRARFVLRLRLGPVQRRRDPGRHVRHRGECNHGLLRRLRLRRSRGHPGGRQDRGRRWSASLGVDRRAADQPRPGCASDLTCPGGGGLSPVAHTGSAAGCTHETRASFDHEFQEAADPA